jgi:hypothetical protein
VATWTAQTQVTGSPEDVLDLLTDPEAISRWAPIPFSVADLDHARLREGDRVRVQGWLAGRCLEFEVRVTQADHGRLYLTATGPIRLEVRYQAVPIVHGSEVRASIAVSGGGLVGRLLAQATDALLASGALRVAMGRIAHELEPALAA